MKLVVSKILLAIEDDGFNYQKLKSALQDYLG